MRRIPAQTNSKHTSIIIGYQNINDLVLFSGFNSKIPRGRKNFWAFILLIQQEEKYCRVRIELLDDAFDEADLLYEARKARRII